MEQVTSNLPGMPPIEKDKTLPLPGWLVKVYFIFPVILYIPDGIFNYYVYSDGWNTTDASPLVQIGKVALVSFLSIGVVGMAYLLSVLAPWHWGQGHHVQAFFCAIGVVIATAITIWNSLAYRSSSFVEFKTDQWAYNLWPQLQISHVSITMILVSIAPPFWGLFWAIVQPTETGRSLRQLQESHAERLLRVQHEAEVKRMKAEANAQVREAQLRGMAKTAAAARDQAAEVLRRKKVEESQPAGFLLVGTPPAEQPVHLAVVAPDALDETHAAISDEVSEEDAGDASLTQPISFERGTRESLAQALPSGSLLRPVPFEEEEPKTRTRSGTRKSSRSKSPTDDGTDNGSADNSTITRSRRTTDDPDTSDSRRQSAESAALARLAAMGGS